LVLLLLLQCAERCIRYVTRKPNHTQPWAKWAHEELLPRLAEFKAEFQRIVKVQAKVKATQKVAGECATGLLLLDVTISL